MSLDFSQRDTGFPREFASFVDFVGANDLHEAISRVAAKLQQLSPSLRALYWDRYFLHTYCVDITDGPTAFQLDVSDPSAIRVASFIAGINRMRNCVSPMAAPRLRSIILGLLRPDRDIRHLEHEVRTFVHFGQKSAAITLVDLEGVGQFDMICRANEIEFEVECKTVTEDTGTQIKTDLLVNMCQEFRHTLQRADRAPKTGVFVLTFKRSPDRCPGLLTKLRCSLQSSSLPLSLNEFDLAFEQRPEWVPIATSATLEGRVAITRDLEKISPKHCATKIGNSLVALALLPHKPSSLSDKIVGVLKVAADQCSGQRQSLIWLHLIGHPEAEFLQLASFSQQGKGAGLNAIVSKVLHPHASTTDRSHVQTIRFSAEAAGITQRPILDEERLIRKARSVSGPCYDVPNPFCRFKGIVEF